jgi:hypothetical protein
VGEERRGREALTLTRLHILAEGQTEEGFVNDILAPVLGTHNIFADVHRITTGRRHGRLFRGGLMSYEHLARDLTLWMKQDQNEDSWFTTMIDYYALPNNFPGRAALPPNLSALDRVLRLETELQLDVVKRLDPLPVSRRLIPYIQLHEFEALLFSNPRAFLGAFPGSQRAVADLIAVRAKFPDPEDIDGNPRTAPSRRILDVLPDYQKPVAGILIAREIGLAVLRDQCHHFDAWIAQLLALSGPPTVFSAP